MGYTNLVFQASWAALTLIWAVSAVNGGYGALPSCAAIVNKDAVVKNCFSC